MIEKKEAVWIPDFWSKKNVTGILLMSPMENRNIKRYSGFNVQWCMKSGAFLIYFSDIFYLL